MNTDFFAVLSVPRTATHAEIKERFRELARQRHPDLFQGSQKAEAEKDFQEITAAFNVLIDPLRRRRHAQELDRPRHRAANEPQELVRVYLNRGIRAYKQGNFIEAANNFDRATLASPDNAQAWHHLALTSLQHERWLGKAQDAIRRACDLRPRDAAYHKLAGKIFARSGMTAAARQYYNQSIRLGGPDRAIRKALAALDSPEQERRSAGKPR